MIDCVTAAPVARRNAGARILRWASFQVQGKVAATSVFPCAKARAGTKDAAPSAAAPASMRLRSMRLVMTNSSVHPTEVRIASCALDPPASPAGLTMHVGFIRIGHLKGPKSGKPDFGWSIFFAKSFAKRWIAGSSPAMTGRVLVILMLWETRAHALGNTRHAASDAATWTLSPGRRNAAAAARGSLTLTQAPPE